MGKELTTLIEGVSVMPLQIFEDDRGAVLRMLRADAPFFKGFGELYFSQVNASVVKGWKRHKLMTQHFAVPYGRIKVVIFDNRPTSKTNGLINEFVLGRPDSYQLLIIPPMTWYGFQSIAKSEYSILTNCADIMHAPEEAETLPLDHQDIPYLWQEN